MNLNSLKSKLAMVAMSALAISAGTASPLRSSAKAATKGFPKGLGNDLKPRGSADVKKNRKAMAKASRRQQRKAKK